MRRIIRLIAVTAMLTGLTVGIESSAASATDQVYTKSVQYGSYTIPATSGSTMGMLKNKLNLWVKKPCTNCYITSMTPDLVYADGSRANVNTGPVLHHMVLASQFNSDPTCKSNLLGLVGERFFASGNERTVVRVPNGYGYYVGYLDQWNLIYELMNMASVPKTVYIKMTFTYRSGSAPIKKVKPVWLDVDQCGDSEVSIPAGPSDTHYNWNVNVPGKLVAIGGHVHTEGNGVRIEATNESTGRSICNSVATYGGRSDYYDEMGMPWISAMSTCIADPVTTLASGNVVRIHSIYNSPEARNDVMGIMVAFIAQ